MRTSIRFAVSLLGASLAVGLWPGDTLAQILRRNRVVERGSEVTPPVKSGDVGSDRDMGQQDVGQPAGPDLRQAGTGLRRQNEIFRSSKIVGLEVLDSDNQRIGFVQDLLINYQGRCPAVFATITSDTPDGHFVVPMSLLHLAPIDQSGKSRAVLSMRINELRNAPRLTADNMDRLRDGRFLERIGTFFDRVERSAAKFIPPDDGGRVRIRSDSGTATPPQPGPEKRDATPNRSGGNVPPAIPPGEQMPSNKDKDLDETQSIRR